MVAKGEKVGLAVGRIVLRMIFILSGV